MDQENLNVNKMESSFMDSKTSIDCDASLKHISRISRSVFNLSLNPLEDHNSMEAKAYEDRLKQEIKEWGTLWRSMLQDIKDAKKKHPVIDCSLLPTDKQGYLKKAPNLQSFLRESVEFRQAANIYLQNDYARMISAQENLIENMEHSMDELKDKKIAENLAMKSTNK